MLAFVVGVLVTLISQNAIKIERGGIRNPKIETVIKLANALGVSMDELVGRKW